MLMIIRDGASNLFRYCEEEEIRVRADFSEMWQDAHVHRFNRSCDRQVRKRERK